MPYMHIGKVVYKQNPDGSRGKKVGTAKGSVKKYLAALYANTSDIAYGKKEIKARWKRRKAQGL